MSRGVTSRPAAHGYHKGLARGQVSLGAHFPIHRGRSMGPFFCREGESHMDELLQEFVSSRGVDMQVSSSRSVIRGVKLLGLVSRNGRRYLPAAMAQAAGLYEGAKVNVNHPKGSPLAARDYQDRLGSIRNVSVREGEGLFGDLHFNPKHALAEQLLWDATHAPENVGFSHNVEARTSRQGGQTVVEAILRVQSVDLVADPATTRGLYESKQDGCKQDGSADNNAAGPIAALTLAQLRSSRPDLIEAIAAESTTRMTLLETELDRLRAQHAALERRAAVVRLLKEFELPDPDEADAASKPIVSDLFFQTLLSAPNDQAMRALVEERATMIAAARRLERGPNGSARPTSREQNRFEPAPGVLDARSFAQAIS